MVSCLGTLKCPLSPTRNHVSLAHCGATWWKGEVEPPQPKLWTSPLASQGPGGRKGHCSEFLPASPHCLGRMQLHLPCLSFQGSVALPNTLGVATWRSDDDLNKTCRGPFPGWGTPPLKMANGWHHPLQSSHRSEKCAKSHPRAAI